MLITASHAPTLVNRKKNQIIGRETQKKNQRMLEIVRLGQLNVGLKVWNRLHLQQSMVEKPTTYTLETQDKNQYFYTGQALRMMGVINNLTDRGYLFFLMYQGLNNNHENKSLRAEIL